MIAVGKPGAYLNITRQEHGIRCAQEAVADYNSFVIDLPFEVRQKQASRCMNCGVPFCQSGMCFNGARQATGCPLHNLIPETNDLLYQGRIDDAAARLLLTNPFPEFTGYVCPAPCEVACNLGLNNSPVTIHDNERTLADYVWNKGLEPFIQTSTDAPLVSIVGSGPAGLACAWECARKGMHVRVYERDDRPGGLLMYGIPNMKLPKWVVERRVRLMQQIGIEFICNRDAATIAQKIAHESYAVILACGSRTPRHMDIPGSKLEGVYYAVDYLTETTKSLLNKNTPTIDARGLDVAVIGGGDTGVDCVATALRQGAKSVRQIIRASKPPLSMQTHGVWPAQRNVYTQSYGQREAQELFGEDPRIWSTDTVAFVDDGSGKVCGVEVQDISSEAAGNTLPAQLVLIAKGFTGPEQATVEAFAPYSNVYKTGDAKHGSSLVATAMADGLKTAQEVYERYTSSFFSSEF